LNFELVDEIQITKKKHHEIHTLKHNELKSKKNNPKKKKVLPLACTHAIILAWNMDRLACNLQFKTTCL
jgi:hypothetical protein